MLPSASSHLSYSLLSFSPHLIMSRLCPVFSARLAHLSSPTCFNVKYLLPGYSFSSNSSVCVLQQFLGRKTQMKKCLCYLPHMTPNCASLCVCVSVCACASSSFRAAGVGQSVRFCVTSQRVYSQRSKWTRYFPLLCVDIGLSAGNSASAPLFFFESSELYLNRKHKAGSLAHTHL